MTTKQGCEMGVVMSGSEFKAYYDDQEAWPDGSYHDDTVILIDGKATESVEADKLAPDAVVEIQSGMVFLPDGRDVDFVDHAEKWRAKQSGVYGQFYAPKDKLAAVLEAIKGAGGQVVER